MNELIKITPNEQGSSVVSGRDLWTFLESKKQFADWMKSRIEKYGLVENQDYTTFSLISEKGRPTIEYALTLDAAKELAMVEGNTKGKEARQFFIEAEKQLRQLAAALAPSSTEQVLIQVLSQQTQLLASLRADVDSIIQTGHKLPPKRNRIVASPPHQKQITGASSLRQLIHQRVNEYCDYHSVSQSETYNYLYKRLHDVYGVNVYRLLRGKGESLIDSVERYGHLDRVYSLIMAELTYQEE